MKKLLFFFSIAFFPLALLAVFAPVADAAQGSKNATSTPSTASFHIRYQSEMIFEGPWEIGDSTRITIKDSLGMEHMATSTSALALLLDIDKQNDSFAISDLAYFDSFQSFLINCIAIGSINTNACFNWQYVVNGVLPSVGADQYLAKANDDIFFFFGTPHRVSLIKDRVLRNESFVAIAQDYKYQTNEWQSLPHVTIGITKANPNDPFSPFVVATSTADIAGEASFTLQEEGTYQVGIVQDFYFPSQTLSVVASQQSLGGGPFVPIHRAFDVSKAIQFLAVHQNFDGSFGAAPLFTDWIAIAFGAYSGHNPAKDALVKYLLTDPLFGNLLTDYERRAMALMSLSLNPYNATKTDYIQKILDGFDGKQFGNPELFNDDAFALLPLLNAGFGSNDDVIRRTVAFILSKQEEDGSWIGVDMTAAAIQALSPASSLEGVTKAIRDAKSYLRSKQDGTGGFEGNPFSTSWAMQAITALEEKEVWQRQDKTPEDYLSALQSEDGGIMVEGDINIRLWATAYAIPGVLGKTWDVILKNMAPPSGLENRGSGIEVSQGDREKGARFLEAYTVLTRVRMQGKGMGETEAKLRVPRGASVKTNNTLWNGDLFLSVATSTQEMTSHLKGTVHEDRKPQGFLEVDAGKGIRLEFDKPLDLFIPVLSDEGTLLEVYVRSKGEDAFAFLETCAVLSHLCETHPSHLSQFVALSKRNFVDNQTSILSRPQAPDSKQEAVKVEKNIVSPLVISEKQRDTRQGIDASSAPFTMTSEDISETKEPSSFSTEGGPSTSFPIFESFALAERAKIIFPFAVLGTILSGVYLFWKFLTY